LSQAVAVIFIATSLHQTFDETLIIHPESKL